MPTKQPPRVSEAATNIIASANVFMRTPTDDALVKALLGSFAQYG